MICTKTTPSNGAEPCLNDSNPITEPTDLLTEYGDTSIYAVLIRSLSHNVYLGSAPAALLATVLFQVTLLALLLSAGISAAAKDAPRGLNGAPSSEAPLKLEDIDVVHVQLKVMQLHACAMQQLLLENLQNGSSITTTGAIDSPLQANSAASLLLPACDQLLATYNISSRPAGSSPLQQQQQQQSAAWANSDDIVQSYNDIKASPNNTSLLAAKIGHLVYNVLDKMYPGPTDWEAVVKFFAIILSLGILSIYVYAEAQRACQLGYVVAVYCQIVPSCWLAAAHTFDPESDDEDEDEDGNENHHQDGGDRGTTAAGAGSAGTGNIGSSRHSSSVRGHTRVNDEHTDAGPGVVVSSLLCVKGWPYRAAALLAPMVQLVTCLLTYAAAALLMAWMQFSSNLVFILVNSLALLFILDLDNVMGGLLAPHVERYTHRHLLSKRYWYSITAAQGQKHHWGMLYYFLLLLGMAALVFAILFAPVLVILESMFALLPSSVFAPVAWVHCVTALFSGINLMNLAAHHPLVPASSRYQLGLAVTYIAAVSLASAITVLVLLLKPGLRGLDYGQGSSGLDAHYAAIYVPSLVGVVVMVGLLAWTEWGWLQPSKRQQRQQQMQQQQQQYGP